MSGSMEDSKERIFRLPLTICAGKYVFFPLVITLYGEDQQQEMTQDSLQLAVVVIINLISLIVVVLCTILWSSYVIFY